MDDVLRVCHDRRAKPSRGCFFFYSYSITPLDIDTDQVHKTIRGNLDFLSQAISTASLRRIARAALEKIHDQLWAEVLMRQRFTAQGAIQFRHDVAVLSAVFDWFVPGVAAAGLSSLNEALVLLTLPVEMAVMGDGATGGAWTLGRVSDRVFRDNAEAKTVMEELGIVDLTPQNARNILQRRTEMDD